MEKYNQYPALLRTNELRSDVEATISCDYEIVGESDKGLELFDADGEHGGGYFPLRFPEEITVEDIRQLIDIPEEVARKYPKLSANVLAQNLFENMDRNAFCCITKIAFVDSTEDLDNLRVGDEFPEQLYNENDNLSCDIVGLFWYSQKIVVVNLHAIENCVRELLVEIHSPESFAEEMSLGIWTTLIHEIRHCMLDNPWLPEADYPRHLEAEEEVEEYAREVFESHGWATLV